MTILCGTDFSPLAQRGCEVAAALAKKTGERLVIVHGLTPEGGDVASAEKAARENLHSIAEKFRSKGLDVVERVEAGDSFSVITKTAQEVGAGLIVVASAGRRGSRWALGTTADRTISTAAVPVLVVREGFPAEEWVGGRPLRVTLATDLSPISDNSIEWASGLTKYGPCEYAVAHISWPPEAYERLGIEGPMPLDRTHPIVEEVIRRDIALTVQRMESSGAVKVLVESSFGKPADSLTRLASEAGADLLVVGHRAERTWRLWEGSVARAVIRSAPMSVACVPDIAAGVPAPLHEIRCIVAATDLSPHGNEAVRYALSLAPAGSRVVVVHILEPGEIAEEARKGVLEGLSALTVGAKVIERGIDARVEMIESDEVAQAICAAAERENADLLCIGTRGRSRLPRMVLGSVSQAILLLCRRPVVIIP